MARNYAALPYEYAEEMDTLSDAEFGRLCRALLDYSANGIAIALSGNERFYAKRVMAQEDRFKASYEDMADKRSQAGKKGASARWDASEDDSKAINANSKNGNAILPYGKNGNTETNTETETKNNTKTNISKPPKSPLKGDVFADFAGEDKALLAALKDFAEMRKHIKAPLTDRAKQMLVNKLQREFEPEQWVPVIEQSTFKGWKDIYAIKGKDDKPPEKGSPNWVGGMPKLEKDYDAIMALAKERAAMIGKRKDG